MSLKLDAYGPDGPGPFATVIVVHGGGWSAGDKEKNAQLLFEPLTKAGFAWFTINYRLWPQYHYPAAVERPTKPFPSRSRRRWRQES